ncbi:aqualysin-1-like [Patiria miniata]|uniref:Peptidase S8/S53 domain-containing protein n=1 Tax=Patiria miniata TaxID=46514 RepID=A0A914BKL5_PATMI|nr:aqualysin-1-like [Patiria miniata]
MPTSSPQLSADTMQVHYLIVLMLGTLACGKLAPFHRSKDPVPSQYLVRIEDAGEDTMNDFRLDLVAENDRNEQEGTGFGHIKVKGEIDGTNLKLFHLELDYKSLELVRKHPSVLYVEEETRMRMAAPVQSDVSNMFARQDGEDTADGYYGLDRINQIDTALDGNMTFDGDGFGVNIYVVDASIALLHKELECRARMVTDVLDQPGEDCAQRDGTTIASVAAGKGVGVAKAATVLGIKVTDCDNELNEMNFVEGIQWVIDHGRTPCVALLGHACAEATSVDLVAEALTQSLYSSPNEGCVVVTAAGTVSEDGGNACTMSPGRTHSVINVAETNAADGKTSSSFYGPCVDIFAPGAKIKTAIRQQTVDGDDDYTLSYGTAISAAFVAGVAAVHLGNDVPTSDVKERILTDATPCVVGDEGRGSPDRMLYVAPGE